MRPQQWALTEIRQRIASGIYGPGAQLPSERELATEMGVARASLRGALSQLEELGILERAQGRGTRVVPPGERKGLGRIAVLTQPLKLSHSPEPAKILEGISQQLNALSAPFQHITYCDNPQDLPMEMDSILPASQAPSLTESFQALVLVEMPCWETLANPLRRYTPRGTPSSWPTWNTIWSFPQRKRTTMPPQSRPSNSWRLSDINASATSGASAERSSMARRSKVFMRA